jgi:hypothetical protein
MPSVISLAEVLRMCAACAKPSSVEVPHAANRSKESLKQKRVQKMEDQAPEKRGWNRGAAETTMKAVNMTAACVHKS